MAKEKAEKSLDELLEEALVKEDEQSYALPGNWVWVKLGTASKINMGQSPKSSFVDDNPKNTPLIGGPKDMGEIYPNITRYTNKPTKLSDVGDLIITIRATLGKTNFSDKKYCLGRGVASLTPHKTEINYLKDYLSTIEDYLFEISTGTTFSQISKQDLVDLPFPLPPLLEQKRIVKKLSSMLGKLKEAGELIQEARETFEERRAAILNKAFTGELTKRWREENPDVESAAMHLHKSFESVKNQYQKECLDCKSKGLRTLKQPEILRYFSQNKIRGLSEMGLSGWCETDFVNFCILQRGFDLPTAKRIKGKHPIVSSSGIIDCHSESKVKGPGFTVGRSGSVGKIFYVEEDYWPLNTTLFSKELNGNDPKYAFYYLSSFDFLKYSSSTAVPTLNRNNFSGALIKVPPVEEQKEIVRILDKLVGHEDEAKALTDMEEQIDLLEKSILSKAFRGQLGTNNPDDEPAIELLKRSLKEKSKAA